jgi:hypothetical protein
METLYDLCDNRGHILELLTFPVEFSISTTPFILHFNI